MFATSVIPSSSYCQMLIVCFDVCMHVLVIRHLCPRVEVMADHYNSFIAFFIVFMAAQSLLAQACAILTIPSCQCSTSVAPQAPDTARGRRCRNFIYAFINASRALGSSTPVFRKRNVRKYAPLVSESHRPAICCGGWVCSREEKRLAPRVSC